MLTNCSLQVIQTSLAQTEEERTVLRGSCPSSLPALPWSQRDNGSKREAENDLLVTWPFQHFRGALLATERKRVREGEGYLCGAAAQRRAVWLLSGSDKIPPYSGRHSLGTETRPGGRKGLLPDGSQIMLCAKQRTCGQGCWAVVLHVLCSDECNKIFLCERKTRDVGCIDIVYNL